MIINILIVFTSELKIYINDRKFKWLNLILVFLISLIVIFSIPYNDLFEIEIPLNSLLFKNSLILILIYYNLKSLNGGVSIKKSLLVREWKNKKEYSYWEIYVGIFLARVVFNVIFLISTLVVGILVISLGGITFKNLLKFYLFLLLLSNLCSVFGILTREFFPKMRGIITSYIYLLFLIMIFFTSFFNRFY